jgi:adenine-specific DNA-methyltransferase
MATKKQSVYKTVDALKHEDATRKNIPTAEYQSIVQEEEQAYITIAYERRNKDLDPQLVWRGKDLKDWSDLIIHTPPLYIQEKVHPKVLIDDLLRQSKEQDYESGKIMADLFSDFNGIPKGVDKTEFYQHDQNWTNRMILGDSLQVMASLAEREGLRGQVQCIYFDPPYGIKFNSNFQWSTTSRDVKDGNVNHITREPEQVKAFRDTWRDGIHSYLTYLRDRLTVARDLLTNSGSIFIQIGDENVHRVRSLMEEIFGEDTFIAQLQFKKTGSMSGNYISGIADTVLWHGKNKSTTKFRRLLIERSEAAVDSGFSNIVLADGTHRRLTSDELSGESPFPEGDRFQTAPLMSSGEAKDPQPFTFEGVTYLPAKGNHWKVSLNNLPRVSKVGRLFSVGKTLTFKKYLSESKHTPLTNIWMDTMESTFAVQRTYVVQTSTKVIQRCILMATDPGDLVLDPTCGSGTTAVVSEQWGRRWITIDTSRVALALARTRLMGARFPFYFLADTLEGQLKEAEITRKAPSMQPVTGNIRHGFVYERAPHITLKSIANNTEIDVIYEKWQQRLDPLLADLNKRLNKNWQEWEVPHEPGNSWISATKNVHSEYWKFRISRQKEIDESMAAKAESEFLYDKPYEDKKKVRVAGPFTVESISPHRVLGVDENDELIDPLKQKVGIGDNHQSFTQMILDNLKMAGVQQAHKEDKIDFTSLMPWPGDLICAEGRYMEGVIEKRAAIFVGAEFGTAQRVDLVTAAREAGDAGFDVLIACAFNYEAHATEFNKLGRIPVLKARMNADLHMADDLKNTGKGNLFVIFGEPDIDILPAKDNKLQVKIKGVDVFHPNTGEVRSDGADGIACWFIDTDYNEESFFVRHAYFLGANDPYSSLKTTLKAEINKEAWDSLQSDTSRPFPKPTSGRIAVKVINHLGDEVMKVFKIS